MPAVPAPRALIPRQTHAAPRFFTPQVLLVSSPRRASELMAKPSDVKAKLADMSLAAQVCVYVCLYMRGTQMTMPVTVCFVCVLV